jgi:ribonuclease P protein component
MTQMLGYKFPKRSRLTDKRLIDKIFREGNVDFSYPFRVVSLQYTKNAGTEECSEQVSAEDRGEQYKDEPNRGEIKILISVRKKQHKRAVMRNLLKRRSREAFRLNINKLNYTCELNLNIAFVYISDKVADYKTIENGMAKCIEKLAHRYSPCNNSHTVDATMDI